jgi:hypothetical protein
MKKFLSIIIIIFWYNNVFADNNELNIKIKSTLKETDIIKINENYSISCPMEIDGYNGTMNSKVDKFKRLKKEFFINIGEGTIHIIVSSKINSKGKISKGKFKIVNSDDFPNDTFQDEEIKKLFKVTFSEYLIHRSMYGKSLLPMKVINKDKAKNIMNMLKTLYFPEDKKKQKALFEDLKLNYYDEYLGTTNIKNEQFYILTNHIEFKHPNKKVQKAFQPWVGGAYSLIHIDSGFGIEFSKTSNQRCIFYKQNNALIDLNTSDLFN